MGVTTKKNIIPIIIGEIILPKYIPNLNQSLFKGVNIFDFSNPKIKKSNDITNDHILTSSLFIRGYNAMIKKTVKKTIPKFRLEPILISSI